MIILKESLDPEIGQCLEIEFNWNGNPTKDEKFEELVKVFQMKEAGRWYYQMPRNLYKELFSPYTDMPYDVFVGNENCDYDYAVFLVETCAITIDAHVSYYSPETRWEPEELEIDFRGDSGDPYGYLPALHPDDARDKEKTPEFIANLNNYLKQHSTLIDSIKEITGDDYNEYIIDDAIEQSLNYNEE